VSEPPAGPPSTKPPTEPAPGQSDTTRTNIWRRAAGVPAQAQTDLLAREEPLEIRLRGESLTVTMRTPGHDAELAAGLLVSEGIVRRREEILEIAYCRQGDSAAHDNILNVFLAPEVEFDFARLTRHVFASASCGLCGKASIEAIQQRFPPLEPPDKVVIEFATLLRLPQLLRAAQASFARTGGLHAAGVFTPQGELIAVREDIGRHNAVDKIVGLGFREGRLPFDQHVLLISGRASFEIMHKALAARFPIVAAVSAPSDLAVEFAEQNGQTLVGFLRSESANVYSRPERIA